MTGEYMPNAATSAARLLMPFKREAIYAALDELYFFYVRIGS